MNTIYLNEEAVSQRGDVQLEHLDFRNASERRTSMVEMCPGVFLLATVHLEKNMCMVELLRNKDKENTVVPSRRLSTGESLERSPKVDNELVNELAKLFRIPKTIQVLPDDEGAISTIHLVLDQNTSSSAGGTSEAGKGPIDRLHLHLFIGTTSGTVLVCNALSGTVLAITQFLRNRNFFREKSATEQFTEEENTPGSGALFQRREKIEGVVKFVVHKKNKHLTFNPSMAVNLPKVAQGPNSTYGVYIVYEAGSVVLLPREALDVFVKVSAEKKDGRRPHFLIDWTVGQDSYPVAGQALEFTKYVRYVYKLRKATRFSQNETITAKNTTARYDEPLNAGRKKPFIRDADFFLFSDNDALDIVSETGLTVTEALVVCGREPAFSFYPLEPQREEHSAARAVKAVASLVTGMAKHLWYSAVSSHSATEETKVKRLEEKPQLAYSGMLEGDSTFLTVKMDPTQQWAAFYCDEGVGRLYIVEMAMGVIFRIKRGCREAQFQWWVKDDDDRRQLLLVLYLPLRHIVEVYSMREDSRIAACRVPENTALLLTSSLTNNPFLLTKTGAVLTISLNMSAGVTAPATLEKRNDTDAGAVGACQTPIDFLRLAQTFKSDGPEDVRRTYEKKIKTLCHALEKRFAPPHLVVRTTDYAALPAFHNSLEDMALLNVSPAQAIQYLHNEVLLVRNYYALLESKVGTAVPAESSFLTPGGGRVVSPNVLSEIILAQTVLLKDEYEIKVLVDAFQSQCDLLVAGRNPFARDTNPTPTATIDLSEYRRHFFCGSDAPTFCGAALYGQDATSYYAILRQLSKIVFLPGLGAFSDRSKNKRRLGFTTELFAQLTFLFISDEFCTDSEQFLSQTSVDLLSQVAMEFSEKILLDTIQSIVIPFCVKRGNEYCISPKLSKYCFILLMCLLLRQKCSSIVSEAGRLVVGRLLRLYAFSLKQVSDPTTLEEETVSLQLCQLAEWRLSNITEKDTLSCFLMRQSIPPELIHTWCAQIGEQAGNAGNDSSLPLYLRLWRVDQLFVMDKKRYFETEWPWLKDGTWDASVFQQLVRTPLQSTPETSLFSQCCHLATALKLLERGLFCFSGTHHSFWEDNCIPDVNFFTRFHAGEAAVSWLESGSTLPFLQSLGQLSTLCLEASKRVFGEATIVENPFKVKCVQSLATTLSADSLLAFPLIPKQMRNYLSNFIDFLTATDINPVRHLEYYSTFIQFLIFFMACPDKKINDKPIPHLKNLNIQWGELFGEVSREHWNVILYVEENPPPYTKENYFRYEGRRMARFAALTREFTRTCVTVSSGSRGEVVASLLSRDMEGMLESLCGITGVAKYISHRCFIFDCLVWYLCPIAVIQAFYQEKIQNNDREAAALLAAADWRLIVRCCLTIARLRDRSLMEKKKAGKSVQAEETAAAIQQLVSEKCNAWLQTDRIVESEELTSQPTDGTDEAAWSSAIRLSILNSPLWTTKAEVTAVREGVYGVLAQPQGSAEKEDLFDLIAFLAGTVKDGSATLPRSLNQIAHEFLIQSLGLRNFL